MYIRLFVILPCRGVQAIAECNGGFFVIHLWNGECLSNGIDDAIGTALVNLPYNSENSSVQIISTFTLSLSTTRILAAALSILET